MKLFLHRLVSYAVHRQRQRVQLGGAFHASLVELFALLPSIMVEFHDFLSVHDSMWRDQARQALHVLANDFSVIHVHGNNLSWHILLDDLILPESLEATFANRHFYNLEDTDETLPGPLDRKNNVYFPHFLLGPFKFPPTREEARTE